MRIWSDRRFDFIARAYKISMAQMNISIPDELESWAEQRVAGGRYSSTSDYVRELIRREGAEAPKLEALRAAIDEGLASGVSERDPFAYIEELRERARGGTGPADAA